MGRSRFDELADRPTLCGSTRWVSCRMKHFGTDRPGRGTGAGHGARLREELGWVLAQRLREETERTDQ